jgi:hypothetical protein
MPRRAIVGGVTFEDAFAITPSDTVNIVGDAGNVQAYTHCYVMNVAAGATVRVIPAGSITDTPVTIYIPQGGVSPLAVKRVFNTTPTPPAGLIGLVNHKPA